MSDLTLQHVVLRLAAVLLVGTVQGWAIAAMAVALGDPGPMQDGRCALWPLRHLDLLGALAAVLSTAGWSRPVAVDRSLLPGGRLATPALVLAPVVATLVLVTMLRLVRPAALNLLGDTDAAAFFVLVDTIARIGITSNLLALLPLPPLAGGHIWAARWPRAAAWLGRIAPMPLAALLVSGVAAAPLARAVNAVGLVVMGPFWS